MFGKWKLRALAPSVLGSMSPNSDSRMKRKPVFIAIDLAVELDFHPLAEIDIEKKKETLFFQNTLFRFW